MQQYADAAKIRTRFVYTCIAGLVQLHVHDCTIPDANKLYTDAAGLAAPVRYLHQEACIAKTVLLHESVRVPRRVLDVHRHCVVHKTCSSLRER
jgi:hypothetical protein